MQKRDAINLLQRQNTNRRRQLSAMCICMTCRLNVDYTFDVKYGVRQTSVCLPTSFQYEAYVEYLRGLLTNLVSHVVVHNMTAISPPVR